MAARSMICRGSISGMAIGPPLCVTRSEIDEIVKAVDESLGELTEELGI